MLSFVKVVTRMKGKRMKIRVAYSEDEKDRKARHEAAVRELFPDTKVRETAAKDGFLHTVLTVPRHLENKK